MRLPRLIGASNVIDMMLSGRVYEAAEAHQILRFSQYLAEPGAGLEKALTVASRIAPFQIAFVLADLERAAREFEARLSAGPWRCWIFGPHGRGREYRGPRRVDTPTRSEQSQPSIRTHRAT